MQATRVTGVGALNIAVVSTDYHGVMRPVIAVASLTLLVSNGCATSTPQPSAPRGTVTVGVTTTGGAAKTMTFKVTIEPAGVEGTVKADAGVFTRGTIPAGEHVVRLLDVPASCRIEGGPERSVTIAARGSAIVRYTVQCR